MNICIGSLRRIGSLLAAATLSTPLAACATSNNAIKEDQRLTIVDLELLPVGEYAAPYNKTAKIGNSCKLVTYGYEVGGDIPVMQHVVYEYVLYDSTPQPIGKGRAATAQEIEEILNNPPYICK